MKYFLGGDSHAFVEDLGDGYYIVGNILSQIYQEVDLDDVTNLESEKPMIFDFLTYDEYEQLRMYFV